MSKFYVVIRKYSNKERPDEFDPEGRYSLYGWTKSKKVLDAFFSQRSRRKYKVKEYSQEELEAKFGESDLYPECMIEYKIIPSAANGNKVPFFTTKMEFSDAQKKILNTFKEKSKLVDKDNGRMILLELYTNLDRYYKSALEYIGFVPPELDAIYDSIEDNDIQKAEDIIDYQYEISPYEIYNHSTGIPCLDELPKDWQKVVFSLEAFIKVLREDM